MCLQVTVRVSQHRGGTPIRDSTQYVITGQVDVLWRFRAVKAAVLRKVRQQRFGVRRRLLHVAARQRQARHAVYADLTWVGFAGDRVPDEVAHLFAIARDARAAMLALVGERLKKKLPVRGFELDDAARAVAVKAGFGDRLLRPSGHCLDTRRFGDGPTFDDAITRDDRQLLLRTGYVAEPGLYVAGAFGVRVAVDFFLAPDGVHTMPPTQQEIDLIR